MVSLSSVANAQDDTAADRADARIANFDRPIAEPRPSGLAGEGAVKVPPPFTFSFALPLTYNTNIDLADSGGRSDFHVNPQAVLDYRQQTGKVRIFAKVAADMDEYFKHEDAGASTLVGRIGLKLVPATSSFSPYIHYTPALVFGRRFRDHQLTLHTFVLGYGGKVELGSVVLKPDFQLVRREATNVEAERNQVNGSVTLAGDIVPDRVSWSLGQSIQFRHYTGGNNEGRDDLYLATSAGISVALNSKVAVEFNLNFEHNSSDRSGKDYSAFDIGPSIGLSIPFGGARSSAP